MGRPLLASVLAVVTGCGSAPPVDYETAEETLSGLAKNKPILIIPKQFRRSWLLARLMPGSIIRMMEKPTAQARQERRLPTWDSEQLSATTGPAAGP